jgi:hypothetical protein
MSGVLPRDMDLIITTLDRAQRSVPVFKRGWTNDQGTKIIKIDKTGKQPGY